MTTAITSPPFGRDTSATDRIYRGRVVSGNRLLAEALYRRLITARGELLDDPNYGFPLVDLLNAEMTKEEEATIPPRIRAELSKDERVVEGSLSVTMTRITTGPIAEYEVAIRADGGTGPFDLVLSVKDLKVSILSLPEDDS